MQILLEEADLRFGWTRSFRPAYLAPVAQYVCWKRENQWDDYNEFGHATRFFAALKQNRACWVDSHLLLRGSDITGCVFLIGGQITALESGFSIEHEEKSLLLKYFHIVEKGRGRGGQWLQRVVFPLYRGWGFENIYLSSSHPQSFPFYQKFGRTIATYHKLSDHGIFQREGRCFLIDLAPAF